MDAFMDKLASKFTAQEMIKANAAAEAEEMSRLQIQVKEYNDCLQQMNQVNQDIQSATTQMCKVMEEEIEPKVSRLVDVCLDKIEKREMEATNVGEILETSISPKLEQLLKDIQKQMKNTGEETEKINKTIKELQETKPDEGGLEEFQRIILEKFDQMEDHVHKENVKVYRNVQAVVVEEAVKQRESMEEVIHTSLRKMTGKVNGILGISLAALIVALGGVVFQIIAYLGLI